MKIIVTDLWKQNYHKHDGEGPGGQKPDDGELPLNGGVVTDHGEHVEPLNRHPEDREEARDDGHNKQAVQGLEVVARPLRQGRDQAYHAIQEERQGEQGRGDYVRVGEERGRRLGQELLDEDKQGGDTREEADAANDNVEVTQADGHNDCQTNGTILILSLSGSSVTRKTWRKSKCGLVDNM